MALYSDIRDSLRRRPRTWLVTGVAGFIGSHLLQALLELDQEVTGLDNFSHGSLDNLRDVRQAVGAARWRRFRLIEGDVRVRATCRRACRGVELVLHQAALGSVPQSLLDPLDTHDTNVTGFANILAAARGEAVGRVVYAGSSAAYGDHPGQPAVESATGQALSPYALSKQVDELYAANFARCYGLPSVGLRYFNVFGRRQDPSGAYAAVIPTWIAAMLRGNPVFINGDGGTTRDFCAVDNVVQANLLAACVDAPAALNQVYNVGVGEATSLSQLFVMLRDALGESHPQVRSLAPIHREARVGDVRASCADIAKAQRLLGYRPTVRVREGIARAIDWYVATNPAAPIPARRPRRVAATAVHA